MTSFPSINRIVQTCKAFVEQKLFLDFNIVISKNFRGSTEFRKIGFLVVIPVALLVIIAILYYCECLNSFFLPEETKTKISKYPQSIFRIYEYVPWFAIISASLLILIYNTIYYVFVLYKDVAKNKKEKRATDYLNRAVIVCFLLAGLATFYYFALFMEHKSEFQIALNSRKQVLEIPKNVRRTVIDKKTQSRLDVNLKIYEQDIDKDLESELTNIFSHFVYDTEKFTLIFFLIFIIMDVCSIAAKNLSSPKNRPPTFGTRIEKQALSQQLWLIDFPVFLGVFAFTVFIKSISSRLEPASSYGFTTGVVAMHIFYSQFVFAVLNVSFLFHLYKLKHQNKKRVNALTLDCLDVIGKEAVQKLNWCNEKYQDRTTNVQAVYQSVLLPDPSSEVAESTLKEIKDKIVSKKINVLIMHNDIFRVPQDQTSTESDDLYVYEEESQSMLDLLENLKRQEGIEQIEGIIIYSHDCRQTNSKLELHLKAELKEIFTHLSESDFKIFPTFTDLYVDSGVELFKSADATNNEDMRILADKKDLKLYGAVLGNILFHHIVEWSNRASNSEN